MKQSQPGDNISEGERRNIPGSAVVVAHELKHPLVLIRQLAFGMESAEDPVMYARKIQLMSEQALRLTSNIEQQARLENSLFETTICDAYGMCKEMTNELEVLFNTHGRTLRVRRARHMKRPYAVVNLDLLRRILTAFAEQILYTTTGDDDVELSVERHVARGQIRFTIKDTGHSKELHKMYCGPLRMDFARDFAQAMNGVAGVRYHRDSVTLYVDVPESKQLRLL